jgi:hypothetical protein
MVAMGGAWVECVDLASQNGKKGKRRNRRRGREEVKSIPPKWVAHDSHT